MPLFEHVKRVYEQEKPLKGAPSLVAGFTILEVLVVLAILAIAVAIATTALRPPSPKMVLDSALAVLRQDVGETRLRAVRDGIAIPIMAPQCNGPSLEVWFFPDGTAENKTVCLEREALEIRLSIDPLTGQLEFTE